MIFSVTTWNINSVRLRLDQVMRYLDAYQPDILCLQEIKCRDEQFPTAEFKKRGYTHISIYGLKGYHGVAIVSRHRFAHEARHDFCGKSDGRCLTVRLSEGAMAGLEVANFYVPAGGDVPDPALNERFLHKLTFLDEWEAWSRERGARGGRRLLVGDLNIAPLETDVWSHKQLLDVVSHTPLEVEKFTRVQQAGAWIDVMRQIIPPHETLFTWWSYRAQDWRASNRGRRLDHIWASPALAEQTKAVHLAQETRDWTRPSDHIPVKVDFMI